MSIYLNSTTYWRDLARAWGIVRSLMRMDEETWHWDVMAARSNPLALTILKAQGKAWLLEPRIYKEDDGWTPDGGVWTETVSICGTPEGIARIVEREVSGPDGITFTRSSFLNGRRHDLDGRAALVVRRHHADPDLVDQDEVRDESYCHGEYRGPRAPVVTAWPDPDTLLDDFAA